MKALFIYCKEFAYTPTIKTVENADEVIASSQYEDVQVALKWICGKNQVKKVVLHSFAHLSESKADPDFTKLLFNRVEERMRNVGYEIFQTPFGYFLDLQIDAPGFSLARVFKNI